MSFYSTIWLARIEETSSSLIHQERDRKLDHNLCNSMKHFHIILINYNKHFHVYQTLGAKYSVLCQNLSSDDERSRNSFCPHEWSYRLLERQDSHTHTRREKETDIMTQENPKLWQLNKRVFTVGRGVASQECWSGKISPEVNFWLRLDGEKGKTSLEQNW